LKIAALFAKLEHLPRETSRRSRHLASGQTSQTGCIRYRFSGPKAREAAIEPVSPRRRAFAAAHILRDEAQAGLIRGPLHGVPVAINDDVIDVAGLSTRAGSADPAAVVAAGMVPLGLGKQTADSVSARALVRYGRRIRLSGER
jgi:Asp-tRNA(Asn)/Glu-tRNA(Gln) amidotransferase A subunit family amidase